MPPVRRADRAGRRWSPLRPLSAATDEPTVWPRPGLDKTPVAKVSFVTKVGDLGCGVGYYK
jgi:hypothetical protein